MALGSEKEDEEEEEEEEERSQSSIRDTDTSKEEEEEDPPRPRRLAPPAAVRLVTVPVPQLARASAVANVAAPRAYHVVHVELSAGHALAEIHQQ